MKPQKTSNRQSKKNKTESITLHYFKIMYKATVIKIAWYWHKSKYIDQWNKIESLEIKRSIYSQLIFNKGDKKHNGEGHSFNKWCWEN